MARAPYNILVLPYRKKYEDIQFCVFKREDMNIWQFVAGGGEADEQPLEAAERESYEEAGIPTSNSYRRLKSMCYVPVECFSEHAQKVWGESTYVIPSYAFAVEVVPDFDIKISNEHLEYKWCNYQEARGLLYYDLDKTAVYELNAILRKNGIT